MKARHKLGRLGALLIMAFVLVFALALPLGCSDPGKTDGDKEDNTPVPEGAMRVTVSYYRANADYEQWNMWLWQPGKEGAAYNFTTTTKKIGGNDWARLTYTFPTIEVNEDGDCLGIIARKGEWSEKDVDVDLFAKQSEIKDGRLNVYLVSGDPTVYYTEEAAITAMNESMHKKITSARFATFKTVTFNTSAPITDKSVFKVKDGSGKEYGTLDCSTVANKKFVGKTTATLSVSEQASMSVIYTVTDEPTKFDEDYNFNGREISKSSLFTTEAFKDRYVYDGTLGAEYSAAETVFTVWSPYATAMKLNIYDAGEGGTATSYDMTAGEKGAWKYTLSGDQKNKYYTYTVINGQKTNEIVDPYARSGGRNGKRGMIVDLDSTDPEGWNTQTIPTLASNSEAVIWEAQLRDVTIHQSSGVTAANRGKFLGLTETGTVNSKGQATALDYLKQLGVTQVHFQPLFDFASVDESFNVATYDKYGEYNWGYDPLNYNMPEGSYSSDPADGNKRVKEMKSMIMALHNAGIQVVMDVVYNHVSNAQSSNFEKLMPGYYFRMTPDGKYYNGSGCGNETASERDMFRKFMIDSVLYWTEEYKIDGFRFDLMGLHDTTTMNKLYEKVAEINPDVIIYGEGWTGGTSGLSGDDQAVLANAADVPKIAFFNDDVRDGLKGSVFDMKDIGFISGGTKSSAVYVGALGGGDRFAAPTQNISYVACHDNSLLWDKLNASVNAEKSVLEAMNRLAAVAVFANQGVSFIPAGEEFMRSKPTTAKNDFDNRPNAYLTDPEYYFADNSYKSPDSVNGIDWELVDTNADMLAFYKELIKIKKTFAQFHLTTAEQVKALVIADKYTGKSDGVAVFAVKHPDTDEYAVVIVNASDAAKTVSLPSGEYAVYVNGANANATTPLSTFTDSSISVGARSAVIMKATLAAADVADWTVTVA